MKKFRIILVYLLLSLYQGLTCKIQKNRCTVTVAPTIEHHGGDSRTPANQRWDQVPRRSQRLLLGRSHPQWMPATQRKCIYGGLTLDVERHYIGSVTVTTHQEKGIIILESNPSRGTVLPTPHGKGNKCDKNVKEPMHCHCGTNNRAPRWTFTDPCKPEVRQIKSLNNGYMYEIGSFQMF